MVRWLPLDDIYSSVCVKPPRNVLHRRYLRTSAWRLGPHQAGLHQGISSSGSEVVGNGGDVFERYFSKRRERSGEWRGCFSKGICSSGSELGNDGDVFRKVFFQNVGANWGMAGCFSKGISSSGSELENDGDDDFEKHF